MALTRCRSVVLTDLFSALTRIKVCGRADTMATNGMNNGLLQRCCLVSTSTWSDAMDGLGVAGVIQGLVLQSGSGRIAGPAVTVQECTLPLNEYPKEAFRVGAFIDILRDGDILVIEMDGAAVSSFGGLAAQATRRQGTAGVVINGGCRDLVDVRASGLWVMSRHVTPVSGKGRVRVDGVNVPITMGGVRVNPGDCIIGDETGLVCVRADQLPEVLTIAEGLHAQDQHFAKALSDGHTFGATARRLKHL
jgi:3-hexulose-6-phosphate synthase / 6-phospho-3-hexuloisomerase